MTHTEIEVADGQIPVVETYRGVGLHDCQSAERLELVRAEIDLVYAMADAGDLFAFACNELNAPEARLLAEAMCESLDAMAREARDPRPAIDMDKLHAFTAGLSSQAWRHPRRYGTLADREAVLREVSLDERTQRR